MNRELMNKIGISKQTNKHVHTYAVKLVQSSKFLDSSWNHPFLIPYDLFWNPHDFFSTLLIKTSLVMKIRKLSKWGEIPPIGMSRFPIERDHIKKLFPRNLQ